MATICKTFATEASARKTIAALLEEGVSGPRVRMLQGSRRFDTRVEPVGGFAGPVAPDGRVGTFAGTTHPRWMAAGGFAGDPNLHRQGSFGDTDRAVITTWVAGKERRRITGDRGLRRLLQSAGCAGEVEQFIAGLHDGRVGLVAALPAGDLSALERLGEAVAAGSR